MGKLADPLVVTGASEFVVEKTHPDRRIQGVHESLLQEAEKDIIWYRENFFGKPHRNFVANATEKGPLAISLMHQPGRIDASSAAGEEAVDHFKVLVRTTEGSDRLILPTDTLPPRSLFARLFTCQCTARAARAAYCPKKVIVQALKEKYPALFATPSACKQLEKQLVEAKTPELPNDLLAMEERQVIRSYKFGLAYIGPGQSTEAQALQNCEKDLSPSFKEFLTFLGEKIELQGWRGYRAGLDVSANQNTGTHSIYTKWQGYEVMFHTSHLLPYSEKAGEQLERKRHIGNDLVIIIYTESDKPFDISTVASRQIHIVALVQPAGQGEYKLTLCTRTGVPEYTPPLPEPTIFSTKSVDRDFFFHKLVNAERATYKAPSFAPKIARTRNVLLQNIVDGVKK